MLNLKPENAGLIRDTMGFAWNLTKITPDDLDRIIDAARAEGRRPRTLTLETQCGAITVEELDFVSEPNAPVSAVHPPSRARLDAISRKAGKIVDGPCQLSDIRRLADLIGSLACSAEPRTS